MSNERNGGFSVGFLHLLTLLFVGLKLTGYIAWSWWWVLSPIWLPIVVIVGIVAVAAILVVVCVSIGFVIDEISIRNRRR